ncbi:hypothetical protein [Mesobacillus jeotgali]|uniref:hypothetical protein n=1 Tax=Mesobacillus jeotgali TaxID=129985 RepID=UPI001782F9BD|nr:hypothetical protein [Mesobacillus jeotgali]UYZ23278.1 hypothetical protein FOF60_06965 [Mesobacillus jeotgali]
MIKAGYNGSGFNDVVWLGDSVNKKSKMCSKVMKEVQYPMVVTKDFYDNLDEDAQKWFTPSPHLFSPEFYYGDIVNIEMRDWLNEQKEKDRRSIHLNKLNLYYRELI